MTSTEPSPLGAFLRDLRGTRRQEDVAREVGVQPSSISNWERGFSRPAEDDLARLLTALGVTFGSATWGRARDLYTPTLAGHADTGRAA